MRPVNEWVLHVCMHIGHLSFMKFNPTSTLLDAIQDGT